MNARLALIGALAFALAAVDLAVKAAVATAPWFVHHRSHGWIDLSLLVLAALLALAWLPSRFLAAASGVLAGGVLGNLVSALAHSGRVDNPLVLSFGDSTIAFNVADVGSLVGIILVSAALAELVIRYRRLLPDAAVATRVYRRLRS